MPAPGLSEIEYAAIAKTFGTMAGRAFALGRTDEERAQRLVEFTQIIVGGMALMLLQEGAELSTIKDCFCTTAEKAAASLATGTRQ